MIFMTVYVFQFLNKPIILLKLKCVYIAACLKDKCHTNGER